MQDSSPFQFIAIDQIHESTTNPRRTFDEAKLWELAETLKSNGMIQPIIVRPNNHGFEIVAGARRYRAAQLAELFSVPARIVEIDDAQALEWALVENAQRVDVHAYEEAQGFQRLLALPGYDVATLAERSGKSASHVYARLSLLQLVPIVAEAFTAERITASHANLIARLPQASQEEAFAQCWRKDWQDQEPHLLPAKHLAAWIELNLYLPLADAPFDREDTTLDPAAGACTNCPRRSGYNTSLFCDVQGDQCFDAGCYHAKVDAYLDREIEAHPGLVQIENAWRSPKQQRPGAIQREKVREIASTNHNPDAEPALPCEATKSAIIVYGKQLGRKLMVCTDKHCPVHDPEARTSQATEDENTEVREASEEQRVKQAEERKRQFEQEQAEREAERNRLAEVLKARQATFERIIESAPPIFNPAQLRLFLRALVNLDPCSFTDNAAEHFPHDDEGNQTAEEILVAALSNTTDTQLTSFALRIVLTGYVAIPDETGFDLLAEADAVFAPPPAKVKPAKTKKVAKKTVTTPGEKPSTKKKIAA